MTVGRGPGPEIFRLILIKPTHYDDDGYLLQWHRSYIPANSLACLNAIEKRRQGILRAARVREALREREKVAAQSEAQG